MRHEGCNWAILPSFAGLTDRGEMVLVNPRSVPVTFSLGFSYDSLRAWSVKDLD
jgi:hypothetical protein